MGWWIFLGILVVILLLPIGASIFYDAAGARIRVIAGPVRFTVFPMKKEKQKKEEPKSQKEATPDPPKEKPRLALPEAPKPPKSKEEPEENSGGSLTDFLPLVELALKFVGEFFHKTLHIDVLYVKLTMAGDDPADLAISYGRAWAALGNLWPYINRMFTIRKRDIQVQCDFEASQSLVNARVDITLNLARLLGLVFGYGFRILLKFMKISNTQKKAAREAAIQENHTQTNEGGAR